MLKSGLSLQKIFSILKTQATGKTKEIVNNIWKKLEEGLPLYRAVEDYLPEEYLPLIKIGEENAKLDDVFEKTAFHLKQKKELKNKTLKSLLYPMFVFSLTLISFFLLIFIVIPNFSRLFSEFDMPLPFLTKCLLFAPKILPYILLAAFLGSFSIIFSLKKISLLNFPILGRFYKLYLFEKFCRGLSYQLENGISIVDALKNLKENNKEKRYNHSLEKTIVSLNEGKAFSGALDRKFFPSFLIEGIRVGEETANFSIILKEFANIFQQEYYEKINRLTIFVEPLSTLAVGVMVGLIAVSVLSPLFSMVSNLQ